MATLLETTGEEAAVAAVRGADGRGVLARGLARSYGDAAQNSGGLVLDATGMDRILSVDVPSATVVVEAGVSLDTMMRRLLPLGLWVPVTPGTRQVTVGGAIAADIHGKNHHVAGTFTQHVASMDLLMADGSVRTITPETDHDLFWATAGGMGLTGIILRATIRMKRVESAYCLVDTERAENLDDLMDKLSSTDHLYTYSVAWIDCLARGATMGRSVLTRGWSAKRADLPRKLQRDPLTFNPRSLFTAPPVFPSGLLNRATVMAFNEVWFRKAPRERRGEVQGIHPFFHPLDGVHEWNRIYGPRGFLQWQFVVPFGAEETMRACIEALAAAGQASFLAVLKRFGPGNDGPLSFPSPGWTLALDIPVAADRQELSKLLDRLDDLVVEAGGRLYLAKDSRVTPERLRAMYPRIDEWRAVREAVDPNHVFTSDLARRLAL
ncbi:FAD-binding oxidoreductase [Kineococcus xinjiangensis]|uniref:FAD-binding oxidoreductase n=1 Tax=Kineococcus xinjiangensis TaxID=512762 RepID=UPI001FE670AD|nr:FAD-binding oxidoreductase [Kineococcus xinjiangensis]